MGSTTPPPRPHRFADKAPLAQPEKARPGLRPFEHRVRLVRSSGLHRVPGEPSTAAEPEPDDGPEAA
jgi:hypothetical protein